MIRLARDWIRYGQYIYPDAAISGDPRDTADHSTAGYDRGDEFNLLYKRIATLREYVLVDTGQMRVDVYRHDNDSWTMHSHGPTDTVELQSIGAVTPIAAFVEGVVL